MQLRRTSGINKLIYLSCNPKQALANFVDLGRRPSKTLLGSQFFPTKAIPVDNFPHTNHCELIILFERYDEKMELCTQDVNGSIHSELIASSQNDPVAENVTNETMEICDTKN